MRVLLLSAAALIAAPLAAHAEEPVMGVWAAPVDDARVEIVACGPKLCGKVLSSGQIKSRPDIRDAYNHDQSLRDRPLKGLVIMNGFTGGPTEWKGGTVYDPKTGSTYSGSIKLIAADQLKLTGCIVYPLCQSQTWKRVH